MKVILPTGSKESLASAKVSAKKFHQLMEDSIKFRGRIIDETISMEVLIDDFLADYFCVGKKVQEISAMIFHTEALTLGSKEKILTSIFLTPPFKYFWKENNKIIERISKVRLFRNYLAHSKLSVHVNDVDNYDGNNLPLISFINGKPAETKAKMVEMKEKLHEILKIKGIMRKAMQYSRPVKI